MSWSIENVGYNVPTLVSTLQGNLYELREFSGLKLMDVEFPDSFAEVFRGPRFGVEGTRRLTGVEGRPIIVRSSSLLEDLTGAAFSGKYKSLFLGNQGPKTEQLAALMDAIAEVYASVFGPDPTEYRTERGLLDVHEEMGILIQEVVGTRVGPYYFPAFAGVALVVALTGTYGVIAYQEQVMRIASALAGFTLGEADLLRKAMGKKKADVMQAQRRKFVDGAVGRGVNEKKATKIFDLMEHFAGYGFNKSHSTAYAFLAYQTAYLKANYPWHFAAALLTI